MDKDREVETNENALLKEYEVCQLDINSSGQQYWTLAGILLGFCFTLLGLIISGIISNNDLFKPLIHVLTLQQKVTHIELKQVIFVAAITVIVSIMGLVITMLLQKWLYRIQYLTWTIQERMREIERILGMQKNLIIEDIDTRNRTQPSRYIQRKIYILVISFWSIILASGFWLIIALSFNCKV